eukprot:TRINITY_DN22126_c1_g1_i1.p1 TRINITY_DN22126_c1_g1~~TRINITY_DN22126_c1_g1_i1.p1  ORF type:complete len:155 (-),score=35.60 TRINITY_DN22126_c1_g1_i1:116-580(-)
MMLARRLFPRSVSALSPPQTLAAQSAKRVFAVGGVRPRFCSFTIHFISAEDKNTGASTAATAKSGQTLLEVAHANDIDIEGACGGECACSTCHVILEKDAFDKMPEPDEDEIDMLDLAAHVEETSRLGCQIKLLKERDDGLRVHIPSGSVNILA